MSILVPVRLLQIVWRAALGFVDRLTDPPIMRRRINPGSDEYFACRKKHEGDSEVDDFLDPGREYDDDAE